MANNSKGNSNQGTHRTDVGSVQKGKGNYVRSDTNGRTTTTSSVGSPGHKK